MTMFIQVLFYKRAFFVKKCFREGEAQKVKGYMQIVSGVYFLIVAVGLFLWIHFFSVDSLINNMIAVVLGLIVLWFLLLYFVMKSKVRPSNKKEEDK